MAVIRMNFLSQALGMQTNVTICLPSFSFKDVMEKREDVYVPGMKYQVLWLLHGGSGDDSDYVNFSNITRYADDHKLAVVMPSDYNMFYTDQKNGGKFFTFITEELPKMCRAIFPFSDKKEDNFVGGLSMGSGGAMKCALLHPEMYQAALIMSGPGMRLHRPDDKFAVEFLNKVIAGEDVSDYKAVEPYAEDIQMAVPAYNIIKAGTELPQLFFTSGGDDFLKEQTLLGLRFYDKMGVKYFYEEIPGYGHEWDFWDLILRKAISEWLPIRHGVIYPE